MISARGWWLLVFVCLFLALGLAGGVPFVPAGSPIPSLTLVCLTLLCWFLGSLLLFAVRLRLMKNRLYVVRQLYDDQGPVPSLWADHTYQVRVQLCSHLAISSPYMRVTERVPYGAKSISGELHADGVVREEQPLEINYYLHSPAPGRLRFEGLQVQCADLQGFFYATFFVRTVELYPVLPAFADIKGNLPAVKRHNILPTAGRHRLCRAGSSSELLDLRDYIPGDPPKTIAWKASARRDRLITKVFENEVPIRCTFFVDASHSVRIGPPGDNALSRLVEIASALAQASAGQRDVPGLCLFDQDGVRTWMRPARGPRHVIQMVNVLAESASLVPATPKVPVTDLLPLARGFAEEVYPDLLRKEVNHWPWWLPLLAPRPHFGNPPLPFWRRALWIFVRLTLTLGLLFLVCLGILQILAFLARLRIPPEIGTALLPFVLMAILAGPILLLAFVVLTWRVSGLLFNRQSRLHRWRKKLAALLAVRHGLMPQGLAEMVEDDALFAIHVQRFLAEHQVPYGLPLYSSAGEYLYKEPGKIDVLTKALLKAVARGKDNELFVLLVDLLETEPLEALLRAVKVARARHHQVILICPWPPEVAAPGSDEKPNIIPPLDLARLATSAGLYEFVRRQTAARLRRAFHHLRRTFGRIGVPVQCATDADAVDVVLDRLRRMRVPVLGAR